MRKIQVAIVAMAASAAGCGGGDGGSSNAAARKAFTYGAPTVASSSQRSVAQSAFAQTVAFGPTAVGAVGLASFSKMSSGLLGSTGTGYLRREGPLQDAREGLLPGDLFTADCVQVSASTYTFKNCRFDFDGGTFRSIGTLDGTATISSDLKTVGWDLAIKVDFSGDASSQTMRIHESGTVTADNNHIKGDLLAEVSVSSTVLGKTSVSAFDEEVIFDIAYQRSPFCVISGTVEVKRVWTQRAVPAQPDKAAKLTWTGCNQATIANSG